MSILETIVAHKLTEVAARKAELPLAVLRAQLAEASRPRDFMAALLSPARPAPRVIARSSAAAPPKANSGPASTLLSWRDLRTEWCFSHLRADR